MRAAGHTKGVPSRTRFRWRRAAGNTRFQSTRNNRAEENMTKVAREMVERAGVDVDRLLDLLIRNASAELTTFYYYTILRVNLIGSKARD
jgi:hypothetical protein